MTHETTTNPDAAPAIQWRRAAITPEHEEVRRVATGIANCGLNDRANIIAELLEIERDHKHCSRECPGCGEPLATEPCDRCGGSGELPGPNGTVQECDECAGVGFLHPGCVGRSYAGLVEERDGARKGFLGIVREIVTRLDDTDAPKSTDRRGDDESQDR